MALVHIERIEEQYIEINKRLNDIEKAHLIKLLLKKKSVLEMLDLKIEIKIKD